MQKLPAALTPEANMQWESFENACSTAGLSFPKASPDVLALQTSLAFSRFVSQTCTRRPDLAVDLLDNNDFTRDYLSEDLKQRYCSLLAEPGDSSLTALPQDQFQNLLRLFRHREMVRIAVRDLAGLSDLNQTMGDLSALADFCLQQAHDYLYQHQSVEWGTPMDNQGRTQQLVVLGMGKLGAHELNFSSDVDLIFTYPRDGQTRDGVKSTSNEDFFQRLGRKLIQMIGAQTAEGFVFRVDMRLRPFGESGPLVLSFDRMEDYYQTQGREWERYALIKARVVAGDMKAGQEVLSKLKPFIYRRYLDYNAFESLRDMKQRIAMEVKSKGLESNIKLGSGGIREVEFFGQMFQLIRGGVQPELQTRGIQDVLKHLVTHDYIPALTGQDLAQAYRFLRRTENRIQAYSDRQEHDLPKSDLDRLRLAAAMGFDDWASFSERLSRHRQKVHHHFSALLGGDDDKKEAPSARDTLLEGLNGIWQNVVEVQQAHDVLKQAGYMEPAEALRLINDLRSDSTLRPMSPTGRERLVKIMPVLLQSAGAAENPYQVLSRLFDLIKSICRRTAYLSLLCEYPATLTQLVRLSEASPWIAALLSRHPVLLDELLDPRNLYRPPLRQDLVKELHTRLATIPEEDLEYQMEAMRIFKQINILRVAASDITHVLPLMKVSDHLSDIAEVILNEVVAIAWRHLVAKHGTPTCKWQDQVYSQGFAVIAYGKLGGLELGYRSDLDLVFLHAAAPGQTHGGPRPIDNAQFFARLGQRVLHLMTAHTAAGKLYETDMRLRPSGDSGMLVSHIQGFRDYQLKDAWTWEHQALIRTRAITGDPKLREQFEQIREQVLTRPRNEAKLRAEVADMRHRLRQSQPPLPEDTFDIKQGHGGIVDIEFLVQYLILQNARRFPGITRWTDNVRLLQELSQHGIIDSETAFGLRRAYLILRATIHRLNLKEQPAQISSDRFQGLRALVRRRWRKYLGQNFP